MFQQFSTLDLVSKGRAEVMVGRGSFIESFPLFGYQLEDYEELFNEKLDMLLALNKETNLNWKGHLTQSVSNRPVFPRPYQKSLPIHVGTGGNPQSTINIAKLGLPIVYAIIGGNPSYFKRLIDLYYQTALQHGHNIEKLKISAHSWGWIGDSNEEAKEDYFFQLNKWLMRLVKIVAIGLE